MNRRKFIKSVSGTAAFGAVAGGAVNPFSAADAVQDFEGSDLRITDVRTFLVRAAKDWAFVKLYTNQGITGLGEITMDGHARTMETYIDEMKRYLIGKDPTLITHHWQRIYRNAFWRNGIIMNSALSGINTAMWDILGKHLKQPVYKLLGGTCRTKIRAYTHCGGNTPDSIIKSAMAGISRGYSALKTTPPIANMVEGDKYMKHAVSLIRELRNAVGPDVDIMYDGHGRLTPAMAERLGNALEEYNLLFFEEPVLPENVEAMEKVAREINIPIATGERCYTKWGFRPYLEKQIVDVIQPDPVNTGGISEVRLIAGMAEAYYVAMAPHNPLSPVNTAVCMHLDAAVPNFLIQEIPGYSQELRKEILNKDVEKVVDGYLPLPEGPGLGIELNEDTAKRFAYDPNNPQTLPATSHEDGSVADW